MCGRYALGIRAAFVRHHFLQHGMPVDEYPEDDEVRETYNFAPGYHGLVYRANVPDFGSGADEAQDQSRVEDSSSGVTSAPMGNDAKTTYKLQAMKWGLIPFWTKRNPDYGTVMKTINARDDSLAENRGMWTSMKKTKRCIVVAQGFYEWLKKNGGREKVPHYVKRADGQLMCFAGLWDCVQYEGSDEKLYTYTIITTDANKQLRFLHDRMPVVLENGSDQLRTWLDPKRSEWSSELQSLLKPYDGELDCYGVSKDVGKVGNNSPDFIVPVSSSENKSNIANFFANAKKPGKETVSNRSAKGDDSRTKVDAKENRLTVEKPRSEDNAPIPVPPAAASPKASKREREEDPSNCTTPPAKAARTDDSTHGDVKEIQSELSPETKKLQEKRKMRSATSNDTVVKKVHRKAGDGSQKITSFFSK